VTIYVAVKFRAMTFLKRNDELQETQDLNLFLANHDVLLKGLKDSLSKQDKHLEILYEMINYITEFLEKKIFSIGTNKHVSLKVIFMILYH
jgi:hypothetical protein